MTDQTQHVAQLEQALGSLKIRLFDTQEEAQYHKGQVQVLNEALGQIVQILGLQPNEQGTITTEAVVEAVAALSALQSVEVEKDAETSE